MKGYNKYLQVYEKSLDEVPREAMDEVRGKLEKLRTKDQPLVSVVLIGYNEEKHLLACLWSLVDNRCSFPIEILAVNNHSTDQTEEVLKRLGVTYFNEPKKGPGHARQCGLNHARGKYHLCIDADTLYPPHYIETHTKALSKPGVACTFGLWSFMPDEKHSRAGLWLYESLRDIHLALQTIKRPELCVRGMVFGFRTEWGRSVGFRTDIRRGEDGSLALALKPFGKLVFLSTRNVRALTGNGTLNADGSMLNSFRIRILKALKNATGLFIKKDEYKDEKDNLIKP